MPIDPAKLRFGPYRTPRVKLGWTVMCAIRGEVIVTKISAGRIPWPRGFAANRGTAMVLCGDLVKAVQKEAAVAIKHWWGVGTSTVWTWRKALGVKVTPGDVARHREVMNTPERRAKTVLMGKGNIGNVERGRKIAAAKLGKPRPAYVVEAMRQANLGRKLSAEHRAKLSAAHKKRGVLPPAAKGPPWSKAEENLLRTLPPEEVAERTGRTIVAVWQKRRKLGVKS